MAWFDTEEEKRAKELQQIHNDAERDGADPDRPIGSASNYNPPSWGITKDGVENNEAYEKGFDNGRKK